MQHRVPSPREIVMHAQSIMQSALIKKKLEEQRENFRKRQDQQQQQQQQAQQRASSPVNSPAKQTMSPTPLAFTPTSVLRKMTADKEPEGANQSNHQLESNYLYSSTINENRNNTYHNAFNLKKNIYTQKSAFYDNAIELTNHIKHGSISEISTSKNLHELNNNSNNNKEIEESALKDKYSSSFQQQKDSNNNSDINMIEENFVYEAKKLLNENINKESNISDSTITTNNNNSPLILDKLLTEQFEIETIIVDNNNILEKIEENKISILQNDEIVI